MTAQRGRIGTYISVKPLFVCATIAQSAERRSHEVVSEYGGADPQLEAVASFGETALHASASEQHRDAPLDAGTKALTLLEGSARLVRPAPRRSLAATLRNAHELDAGRMHDRQVLLAEEAAIRAIQLRGPAKGLPVTLEGRCHVDLVGRIAFQHLVLRDQALCAFGEEDFVAELDRRAHLAALDQVGMGLEDGIDLLVGSDLLAKEHTTTCLIDDTISQPAEVLDLSRSSSMAMSANMSLPRIVRVLSSPARAFPTTSSAMPMSTRYVPGLLLVTLPRRHALDLVHPAPCGTRAVAKSLDVSDLTLKVTAVHTTGQCLRRNDEEGPEERDLPR